MRRLTDKYLVLLRAQLELLHEATYKSLIGVPGEEEAQDVVSVVGAVGIGVAPGMEGVDGGHRGLLGPHLVNKRDAVPSTSVTHTYHILGILDPHLTYIGLPGQGHEEDAPRGGGHLPGQRVGQLFPPVVHDGKVLAPRAPVVVQPLLLVGAEGQGRRLLDGLLAQRETQPLAAVAYELATMFVAFLKILVLPYIRIGSVGMQQ